MFLPEFSGTAEIEQSLVWKDGGCSDPVFAGKLQYSNGSIHCDLWRYSNTKSLYSYGMIFLSQDLKIFVIIFIPNVQAFFSCLKTVWVGKKYPHSPTFTNPVKSQWIVSSPTLHYLKINNFPYENVTLEFIFCSV